MAMIDEIKKPPAPAPPSASIRTSTEITTDKSPNKIEKTTLTSEKQSEVSSLTRTSGVFEKTSTLERLEKTEEKIAEKPTNLFGDKTNSGTLERRLQANKIDKTEAMETLITQLNNRVSLWLFKRLFTLRYRSSLLKPILNNTYCCVVMF